MLKALEICVSTNMPIGKPGELSLSVGYHKLEPLLRQSVYPADLNISPLQERANVASLAAFWIPPTKSQLR